MKYKKLGEAELCLEAKMAKLRLSNFGYSMRRQDLLEKTTVLENVEGNRKRRTNTVCDE